MLERHIIIKDSVCVFVHTTEGTCLIDVHSDGTEGGKKHIRL